MTKISKNDIALLNGAKLIHDDLKNGRSTGIKEYEFEVIGNENVINLLAKHKYISIDSIPKSKRKAYLWLEGQLRPYQVYMKQLALKSKDHFIILGMPTGTGKTKTALSLIKGFPKTLFITPRINLSHQTKAEFEGELESLGIMQGNRSENLDANHVVCNLQTLQNRVKRINKNDLPFYDVAFFDECHYSYEQITTLIPLLNVGRVIGLSGTPYYADGSPLKDVNIIEPFDVNWFVEHGYLANVRCLQTILIDNSKLKKSKTESGFTNKSVEAVTNSHLYNEAIVESTKDRIKGQCIVFASSINHCELLTASYEKAGFKCLILHSGLKDPLISLEKFKKKEAQLLVTVNMVSFGTDIPEVETAVVARPIGSKSLYRQIIGRILRLSPNKKEALLLDCGGNIKRLGHPFTRAKPTQKKHTKKNQSCKKCNHEKAPYLFKMEIIEDRVERIYKCAVCSDITVTEKELETIECDGCGEYHLSTKTEIRNDREVLVCGCGITTIIRELDKLELVLNDDSLLDLKLRHYIANASMQELIKTTNEASTILNDVENEQSIISSLLLDIENSSISEVALTIKKRIEQIELEEQKIKSEEEANYLSGLKDSLIEEYKLETQSIEDKVKKALIGHSQRFIQKGYGGLNTDQVERITNDYHNSTLLKQRSLNHSIRERIENIEANREPLSELVSFIPHYESYQ